KLGEEDLPGRDRVEGDAGARPVAHLYRVRVRRLHLVDVLDGPAIANRHPGGLRELRREVEQRRACDGDDVPRLAQAGRDGEQVGPEAIATLAGNLLDRALRGERREQ